MDRRTFASVTTSAILACVIGIAATPAYAQGRWVKAAAFPDASEAYANPEDLLN